MLFMTCFVSYMLRVNISINIIAMVKPTTVSDINVTYSSIELPDVSWTYLSYVPSLNVDIERIFFIWLIAYILC